MKPLNGNRPNPALKMATAFLLLFLFAGILFSVAHGIGKVGLRPAAVSVYYLGSEEAMSYPKELPELLESTHVHLFMVPLIFYLLCHLFAQTSLSARAKQRVIFFTFASVALFLTAPYGIRFVSPGLAFLVLLANLALVIMAAILTGFPLMETFRSGGCGGIAKG